MDHKSYFNMLAEKWDKICVHDSKKIEFILDKTGVNKGAKVLDVGTGTGVLIPFLLRRIGDEGEIYAVDIAEKMLEVAAKKFKNPNVHFIEGDICSVDLPHDFFDLVICYSVFPHFNDKQAAILKMKGFLKSGGCIAICHSQGREEINKLHRSLGETVACDCLPSADVISQWCHEAGMKTIASTDDSEMFLVMAQK